MQMPFFNFVWKFPCIYDTIDSVKENGVITLERYKEIERSIIKTYRKSIWKRFIAGINKYKMINEGDKIAVCISGGKDSMLMAKCIQEIQRHGVVKFDAEYLVMDPGYNADYKASQSHRLRSQ